MSESQELRASQITFESGDVLAKLGLVGLGILRSTVNFTS